ncbi:hypothetical protein GLP14_15555 [Photobacterium carnosum]|uniref:hypothetical protein n=1 Tax=Photobacterium carnosum TaxID=2023717 RepID=UPI001E3373B6|nr:hypothetical protein [Photobacterium carnosum]MCD9524226.1 hypothetical protein [Photobacterium carnosum]
MMNNEQQQRSDYLYEQHVTHLTLQGKCPATIDGYSRALRRITHHFESYGCPMFSAVLCFSRK